MEHSVCYVVQPPQNNQRFVSLLAVDFVSPPVYVWKLNINRAQNQFLTLINLSVKISSFAGTDS